MLDADCSQFAAEIGIAAIKKIDAVDQAFAVGGRSSNHIRETGTEIGNHQFCAVQFGGSNDDCGVTVIRSAKSATSWSEAFGEHLNLCAQAAKCIGVAEAVFVHRLVDDADAIGLRERSDEW